MTYTEKRERKKGAGPKPTPIHLFPLSHDHQFQGLKETLFLFSRQEISEVFQARLSFPMPIPFFDTHVQAGLPSPVYEFTEGTLDLNEHLIKHKTATFFVRVVGESMTGAAIFPGDLLIVDRIIEATSGKIIIALLNGGLTVKRLHLYKKTTILCAENKNYSDIKITKDDGFSIWGVVTNVIHSLE